jgi:N-acetylneuraminate synthase
VAAKADAVKFQLYTAKKLYAKKAGAADYIGKKKSIYDIIKEMELPVNWLRDLKKYCEKKNIMFLCTPFDEASVDALERVGMPAYKIASYSLTHTPLLTYIARLKKPIIMSTGASDFSDVRTAIEVIRATGNDQIALMQCTAKYPAPLSALHLRVIPMLIQEFKVPVGLSDHSREPYIGPVGAVALGAKVIEKHYTTDNALPGPDHGFAILDNELVELVKQIRMMEESLGTDKKTVHAAEKELHAFTRPGIFATKKIRKGEKLSAKNTAVLREGKMYNPNILLAEHLEGIIGVKASRNIKPDEGVTRTHLFNPKHFATRKLKSSDSLALWKIRNTESVRKVSNNSAPIPKASHTQWFAQYIKNPKNNCFVITYENKVAGYCRIDSGLVSIAIDPLFQGMGLGKKLLTSSVQQASQQIKTITATIHKKNEASLKLFTSVGFTIVSGNKEVSHLEYRNERAVRT